MKKFLIIFVLFIIVMISVSNNKDYYVIPKDSIRFRIIANSNNYNDQFVKIKLKQELENEFMKDLDSSTSIENARKNINNNIDKYEKIVKQVFNKYNYNKKYKISFGDNYFPEKVYKGVVYEEGNYESLVISIGDAAGENWWCVLYPPICAFEETEKDDIEYKFFIKEIIDKYF